MTLLEVANSFQTEEIFSVEPYGEGHINVTYVAQGKDKRFILQKINTRLFTKPDQLMFNIASVCSFMNEKIKREGGDVERGSLTIVKTKAGEDYLQVDGDCYRMYVFIERAIAHQKANEELFYQSAVAFGRFANDLSAFDASVLHEILPGFHDTTVRYQNLENAVKEDVCDRAKLVKDEIDFYLSRKKYASILVDGLKSGKIPLRVTHNDTKLNNVMLDEETGLPVAVIDLDTIMPGSICYDFGDSIRFGCNTGAEDEPDLDKVHFSLPLYKSYAKGYLSAFLNVTAYEREMLPYGAYIMTYECGMRFLTDFLQGDVYFRTTRPNQNVDRCRTHIKLMQEMEENFDEMKV